MTNLRKLHSKPRKTMTTRRALSFNLWPPTAAHCCCCCSWPSLFMLTVSILTILPLVPFNSVTQNSNSPSTSSGSFALVQATAHFSPRGTARSSTSPNSNDVDDYESNKRKTTPTNGDHQAQSATGDENTNLGALAGGAVPAEEQRRTFLGGRGENKRKIKDDKLDDWPTAAAHGHEPEPTGAANAIRPQQQQQQQKPRQDNKRNRWKRSPWATSNVRVVASSSSSFGPQLKERPLASSLLMPINELRVSGSKSEPPSRPSFDWSKQRPHFGQDIQRNVSVELGKTAYLTCKVFELGDKTVSWLRPRENEILTAGRYTYIGDPRFSPINDNGSNDWILEIKDVGLNDSTNYECQVSTDPKMSVVINLHVEAAKSRIKQGEQYYASLGANIEFTCEVLLPPGGGSGAASRFQLFRSSSASLAPSSVQQTYWYHNGNLINYAKTNLLSGNNKNFSIDWDQQTQTSRLKLFAIQASDSGNYTCKPTSAEPSTIRLHVKRPNKGGNSRDRVHYSGGYHVANTKEAQRNRQHYGLDMINSNGLELIDPSNASGSQSLLCVHTWLAFSLILLGHELITHF